MRTPSAAEKEAADVRVAQQARAAAGERQLSGHQHVAEIGDESALERPGLCQPDALTPGAGAIVLALGAAKLDASESITRAQLEAGIADGAFPAPSGAKSTRAHATSLATA